MGLKDEQKILIALAIGYYYMNYSENEEYSNRCNNTDFEDNGKISIRGLGDFESFELVSGSQYIADLSGTRFEFDLQLSHQLNELQSGSRFSLAISNDPLVVFDGDLALRMGGNSVFGCVLNGCNLTELLLKYNLSAGDTSLVGSSRCIENKCTVDDFRHSIKTSDTRNIDFTNC